MCRLRQYTSARKGVTDMPTRDEMIENGYKYYCIACKGSCKELPMMPYDTGHGMSQIPMCRCGSDLFADLKTDEPVKEGVEE